MPAWTLIPAAYLLMSLLTFFAYAIDKRRAALNQWRIRERTLHALDFLGGWPGGLAAQRLLRHKTRDTRFLFIFWCTVVLHAGAWIALVALRLRG